MSWQAAAWAKKSRAHSPTHRHILLVTADYATDKATPIGLTVPDGWAVCWAGVDEIADDCGVSPRTVMRAFAALERDGFIRRDRRYAANPRAGQPGQPKTVRTTDAVWINWARPTLTAPPNEAKRAAKARAGRLGGKVSAARRSAEREASRAAHDIAAAAVFEALGGPQEAPPEPDPQVTVCLASGDNVLAPQVTPSVTAEPSEELPTNRQHRVALIATDRAREAPEEDHSTLGSTTAAGPPDTQQPPAGAGRPPHRTSNRPPPLHKRRPWIDDGSGPEPARYRRPPADPPEASP